MKKFLSGAWEGRGLELGGSWVLPCSHVCIAGFIHHLGVTRKSFKKCIYFSFTTSDLVVAEII